VSRSSRGAFVKRLIGFAGLPFLSLVTPLLFLPVLARVAGADAWVAFAVGQSIGGFFALIVSLGYNTVGPRMVAVSSQETRPLLLAISLRARILLWVPSTVVAIALSLAIAPSLHRAEAALMATAMTLTGLSSAWYMIGLGSAGSIAIFEIFPRIAATLASGAIVLVGGSVLWYPVLLILAIVIGVGSYARQTLRSGFWADSQWKDIAHVLRSNRAATATEVSAGLYNSLSVTFVGASASTSQAASYVSGDKLYRMGQYSVSALGNALQGWVVENGPQEFGRRARVSFALHLGLGLIGCATFALLGPWLSALLFGAGVAIDEMTALGLGVATIAIALGTTLGRVTLVGMGGNRAFLISVLLAACVGVPAIIFLSAAFGAAGGAWGLAIGEFVSVIAQSVSLTLLRRRSSRGK